MLLLISQYGRLTELLGCLSACILLNCNNCDVLFILTSVLHTYYVPVIPGCGPETRTRCNNLGLEQLPSCEQATASTNLLKGFGGLEGYRLLMRHSTQCCTTQISMRVALLQSGPRILG
ncbi:hypothetical protein F4806DRAFT_463668 [Annulohypoxylon nitens]|nr:hypothetical protein F4806DRAFT_463668 [Annulohypoxylon nitens]